MASKAIPSITEEGISESYIYLLGRLLVTRQQQLDFQEGFKWNELLHRKPGLSTGLVQIWTPPTQRRGWP